jgi:hypothetical protein
LHGADFRWLGVAQAGPPIVILGCHLGLTNASVITFGAAAKPLHAIQIHDRKYGTVTSPHLIRSSKPNVQTP